MKHKFKLTRLWVASLLLLFGFTTNAWADKGFDDSNNGVNFWKVLAGQQQGADDSWYHGRTWSGRDLGTVTSLYLKSYKCQLYQNKSDDNIWGNGWLYFNVHRTAEKAGTFIEKEKKQWNWGNWDNDWRHPIFSDNGDMSVNLLSNLASGKYTFEYYFKANGSPDMFCNNGDGSNFHITFTYNPLTSVSGFTHSVSDKASGSGTSSSPYIIKYNTNTTLTVSATACSDANAKLQFKVGSSGTWTNATSGTTLTTTISSTSTLSNNSVTIYYRYYNSDDELSGGENNTTIYYRSASYAITLNANGGTANGSVTATYGGGLSNYSPATHATANLTGYYTSEGSMVIDATGALISGTVSGWVTDGKWVNTKATQTLYAQWQSEATLSFNKNTTDEVTNMPSNITRNPGNVTISSTEPTRTGYTFKGWDTNKDATTGTYAAGATFDLQSNTELFAIWQENKYTITVNSWNSSTTVQAGIATHPDVSAATKFGSNFSSWMCDDGISVVNGKVTATKAGTITAVYAQNQWMFIEGRFAIYNEARTNETRSYTSNNWATTDANISMDYDADHAQYILKTYKTPKELSDDLVCTDFRGPQYFWIRGSQSSSSATIGTDYKADAGHFTSTITSKAFSSTKSSTPKFENNDESGFVTLYWDGTNVSYTVAPVQYTVTFGVKIGEEDKGSVTATADGVAILSGASVNRGARVVFTSNPGEGYYCKNWYDNGVSSTGSATKTIESLTAAHAVEADFNEYYYTVTMQRNPDAGGTVTPSATQTLYYHTPIDISYTENTGYHFTGWQSSHENVVIANGQMSLKSGTTTTGTATVTANFEKNKYTVTINTTEGGVPSPSGVQENVTQLDGIAINATPNRGYYFVNWTKTDGNGSFASTETIANNNFKPTAAATIQANFKAYVRSLSVTGANVGKTATVTFNKDSHYDNAATITYELWNSDKSAKVEDGTTFDNPSMTGATFVAQVAGTYTVKAIVKQNETIVDEVFSPSFTIGAVYTVNFAVSPTEKGSITTPETTPKEDVTLDTPFAISASAGIGYHFNKWVAEPAENFTFGTVEGDDTKATTTATMTDAAVTSTIMATFSPNTYSVRFNANSPTGQKATGTMEDQSFEYDEAAKALTENAFVRLGYTFQGWATTAGGAKEYDDKQAVQNLATESGAVVNLYAVWQLKNDCSIEVVAPAIEDGTITPSDKVENENVEGGVHEYTFTPASDAVTFMNWTITNAICVEGTNERSNPVKIKTYGEATIRANVKENLVSVTLKVLPNDQWGYFNVNGNNVASGTVINVGAKTTAKVFANTNFGYKFVEFEKSDGFDNLINFNDGTMQGKGAVGKVTLIARFAEDNSTGWYLGGFGDNWSWNEFKKHNGETTKKIAYFEQYLDNGTPRFKISHNNQNYGNSGTMTDVYNAGWVFKTSVSNDCNINLGGHQGTYVFCLDYSDENNPKVTLLYPYYTFEPNTTIYFNNYHNAVNWPNPVLRIGTDDNFAEGYAMKLVPGTANLYSYTFVEGWRNYKEFVICDNWGWTGAKDKTQDASYGIMNIGQGDWKIKHSITHYNGITVDKVEGKYDYVIQPTSFLKDGDYGVKYYNTANFSNRENSKFSVTYTAHAGADGTLTVEQWENNDGSARTTIAAGTTKVDQSRWITITATPQIGYKFVKMSVTTNDGNTENHYQTTWKYAVQQNITAITATFAPVNTYTFYVKNVDVSDTKWHKNGETAETRDVYLYYDNGQSNAAKVSYWGWPGLMATPMDDNHEWYKVEMTNAYFDIQHWRLNNGVGADCPQTEQYVTADGAPVFNDDPMEGKYYELVYDNKNTPYETYKLQVASTPDFYRVITNDGKYTSNVATVGEKVSFFATTDGAKLQKSGESGWTDVDGGTISISESNVYVATINEGGTGVSTPEVYEGNYYIRTDGATGGWSDYKDPSKNNAMTYFTPRPGETYSYYWVQNLGKFDNGESSGSFNVKAKVANDYNDNLAGEIANDANTNIYGNINKTTNGANVRFSYEPTTNEFKRAILSGSAEDSYLNIVGANIYSDESCKSEFALNMDTYKNNPKACKLRDVSDWVYEMTIYAQVPNNTTNIGVDMYSLYNGNRSTLLNDKVIMAKGTDAATYKLRVTYDFKKNRIITSWAPSSQEITQTMTVNADIQFLQNEKGDVSQITLSQSINPNVKSLEYLLYVLEIEDPGEGKRKEEHYRISLPFDCRVSDIYGLENYVKLNEAGQPISGDWGIQKYNGELRAQQGWYDNSPIQNFWTWLSKDDTLKAGRGYSVSIDKSAFTWATIGEEVTRTICDANGTNCQDVTTTEDRASHRLYFPSMNPGFDLKNSGAQAINYPEIHCEKTQGNRNIYDSDWRFIGSSAYNNITTKTVTPAQTTAPAPAYLYVLNSAETEYEAVAAAENFVYHSFGAYMMQFHGDIEWNIYTQSHPESQAPARRYSAIAHAPLKMHVDVMEGEEMAAQAFVELNDQATTGFDQKMDLTLMKSSKVARAYTTTEGIDYAANCLPFESTIVPMTVNTLHAGDYTLHLEGADNVAVYLIDFQLQTETLISAGDVTVELEKGSSSDRFALRFDVAAVPTDIKNANGETMMNDGHKTLKLLRNGNIYLINGGRVYNATGAELR